MWAFNGLSHLQQVFALLLHKPREDEPHSVKEWFLRVTGPQRHAAWQDTIGRDGALERVQRESKLRHMEVFFQERRQYGTPKRMKPAYPEGMCPEKREKQRVESDLYVVTRRLKRKLLSLENMKDFQLWKSDLMEAWAAMYLPIEDYQSVNHLIGNRLDLDIQAMVGRPTPQG